jgi:hypothetical protein
MEPSIAEKPQVSASEPKKRGKWKIILPIIILISIAGLVMAYVNVKLGKKPIDIPKRVLLERSALLWENPNFIVKYNKCKNIEYFERKETPICKDMDILELLESGIVKMNLLEDWYYTVVFYDVNYDYLIVEGDIGEPDARFFVEYEDLNLPLTVRLGWK